MMLQPTSRLKPWSPLECALTMSKRCLSVAMRDCHSGAPTEATLEPALLLVLAALGRERTARRERDAFNAQLFCRGFVRGGEKAAIRGHQLWCALENSLVLRNGRHPCVDVGGVAVFNVVVADDAVLDFVDADQPSELGGLVRLALAYGLGVDFEEAEDLSDKVRVTAEHARLGLRDHLLDEGQERVEPGLL